MIGSGDRLCQLGYKVFEGWVGKAGRILSQRPRAIASSLQVYTQHLHLSSMPSYALSEPVPARTVVPLDVTHMKKLEVEE